MNYKQAATCDRQAGTHDDLSVYCNYFTSSSATRQWKDFKRKILTSNLVFDLDCLLDKRRFERANALKTTLGYLFFTGFKPRLADRHPGRYYSDQTSLVGLQGSSHLTLKLWSTGTPGNSRLKKVLTFS